MTVSISGGCVRLVLVATAGNQAYVFAGNRLREAVGASYLISEATTSVVRRHLGDGRVVSSSSGSALVVVDSEEQARELVRAVSGFAAREAPGLSVVGVHMPIAGDEPTAAELVAVRRLWHRHVDRCPGVGARWPRLPVVAACTSTDLPAAGWFSDGVRGADGRFPAGERPVPLSVSVVAKRRARWAAHTRMARVLESTAAGVGLGLVDTGDLLESVEWVGVVHADANRLGRVFQRAPEALAALGGFAGDRSLGALSAAVQRCADEAFGEAVAVVAGLVGRRRDLPVVPLVVGGDDLTVLVDGRYAAAFAQHYLAAFGTRSAGDPLISAVSAAALPDGPTSHVPGSDMSDSGMSGSGGSRMGGLTVSAGVAVVKPLFPFSMAYELADELCRGAKRVAAVHPGCHGLDVHVLLDSSVADLAAIRAGYEVWDGRGWASATRRPFLLPATGGAPVPPGRDWRWLTEHAELVREAPNGGGEGRVVTRSQLHALRGELRTDPVRAARRVEQWRRRAATSRDRALVAALSQPGPAPVLDLLELAEFAVTGVSA
ncbi:hypothetical protein ACFV4N_35000 [Actinosynnema sp. NPDC059797]